MQYQAAVNWVPLLFVVGGILYKLYQGYQRGDVETEEQAQRPSVPSSPQAQRPHVPLQRPQPTPSKSREQGIEGYQQSGGWGTGQSGGLPTQVRRVPSPVYSKPRPSPQQVPIIESQSPSLQDDPAGLITRGGSPLYETSVERFAAPVGDVPIVTASQESEINHFAWLRDRLRDRSETQRSIILSEVLQPPVAMRGVLN